MEQLRGQLSGIGGSLEFDQATGGGVRPPMEPLDLDLKDAETPSAERGDVSGRAESGCRGWRGGAMLGQEGLDLVNGSGECAAVGSEELGE